jgi:hypothetical protein
MGSHAQDVHGTGLDLHHEQHVQPVEQHGVDVQEVTDQDARGLSGQELPPRRRCPPGRGAEAGAGQDPADRPLPHPVAQPGQLALDAPAPPARVLPCYLLHQRPHLIRDRRPSRPARIRPFPLDQAAVPGQQRARRHDAVQPQVPRQQPRQGGEDGAVSPIRPRPRDLPAQHSDLVPQHQDLRILRGVTARQERQPAEHPGHEQVDEANEHERRA